MIRPFLSLVVLAALAALLAGCSSDRHPVEAAAQPPLAIHVETLHAGPIPDTFDAPGTVRARHSATIASKVVGYVQDVRVKPGDRVRAGQVLVTLTAPELDAQVAGAQAAREAAENGLLEAEKARTAAESSAQLAAATYQRYTGLLEKKSVSRQEFDEVEARYKAAAANLEMAGAAISRARAGRDQASATVKSAETMHSYITLAAPFAGLVSEKRIDPGSLAMPGQPLLVVEQGSDFRLEATVEESRIPYVKMGQAARVWLDAAGAVVDGRVAEIVPSIDPGSRAFTVKIDLEQNTSSPAQAKVGPASSPAQPLLRSGQFGRATFIRGERRGLTVSERSIRADGQLTSVFVAENGVARQRLVTLGARTGGRAEVLSGLADGDRVILDAAPAALRDGAPVEEVRQ